MQTPEVVLRVILVEKTKALERFLIEALEPELNQTAECTIPQDLIVPQQHRFKRQSGPVAPSREGLLAARKALARGLLTITPQHQLPIWQWVLGEEAFAQ